MFFQLASRRMKHQKKPLNPLRGDCKGCTRSCLDPVSPLKIPRFQEHTPHLPMRDYLKEGSGRFSGLRIFLVTAPSRPVSNRTSGYRGFRSRSQRRDRDGFAPSSLLNPKQEGCLNLLVFKERDIEPQRPHPLAVQVAIVCTPAAYGPSRPFIASSGWGRTALRLVSSAVASYFQDVISIVLGG